MTPIPQSHPPPFDRLIVQIPGDWQLVPKSNICPKSKTLVCLVQNTYCGSWVRWGPRQDGWVGEPPPGLRRVLATLHNNRLISSSGWDCGSTPGRWTRTWDSAKPSLDFAGTFPRLWSSWDGPRNGTHQLICVASEMQCALMNGSLGSLIHSFPIPCFHHTCLEPLLYPQGLLRNCFLPFPSVFPLYLYWKHAFIIQNSLPHFFQVDTTSTIIRSFFIIENFHCLLQKRCIFVISSMLFLLSKEQNLCA